MAKKTKVEPDAAPSTVLGTGGATQWIKNQQKSRPSVPTNTSRGGPPATPKFNGTCDGLKVRGFIFDSANFSTEFFTHVKRDISKYIGKEYSNGGDF